MRRQCERWSGSPETTLHSLAPPPHTIGPPRHPRSFQDAGRSGHCHFHQTKTFFQYNASQWINENEGLLVFSFCPFFKRVCVRKSVRRTKRFHPATVDGRGRHWRRLPAGLPPAKPSHRLFCSLWLVRTKPNCVLLFSRLFYLRESNYQVSAMLDVCHNL